MDRSDNFQIQCRAYRMPQSRSSNPQIPRYWITIGKGKDKETIWDWPGNFKDADFKDPLWKTHPMKHQPYIHVPTISQLIRDYINTPRKEVQGKVFENDLYGLTDILKQYDRRFK